uniref:EF-hand domain-containing protein n=2 Tax=Oncorhynchus tshawytscha TaxID=74940 RepID=A0AAZ3R2H3_ONCTS
MTDTMSRLSSVASLRLPAIQHPLSRLIDPETLSLRGYSRNYAGSDEVVPPLLRDVDLDFVFRGQNTRRATGYPYDKAPPKQSSFSLVSQPIPEGVEVSVALDPVKPRLPIFGQRVAPESRGSRVTSLTSTIKTSITSQTNTSRTSILTRTTTAASCPEAQLRIQVDQLEHELRQNIQLLGHLNLQRMFKNNHPEGKALANRDVLLMILTKFLGRFITLQQYSQLLLRLHLSKKAAISFEELWEAIRESGAGGPATWFNPTQDPSTATPLSPAKVTASQTLSLLRGQAQNRFLKVIESRPTELGLQRISLIVAPELKRCLAQLGLNLEDREFEKLWKKFDSEGLGAVNVRGLLRKLGLSQRKTSDTNDNNDQVSSSINGEDTKARPRALSKSEEERGVSITMEKWLKDKFREGVQRMKSQFDQLDPDQTYKVGLEEFLQVLKTFGLNLKREHVGLFLARCGLGLNKTGVIHYPEFLRMFQDRSEEGVTHRILSNPQHRFHHIQGSISHASTVTMVEAKLARLFQSEYLSLLEMFQSIDKCHRRVVSQEEFRAAIESRFGLEVAEPEFDQLLDRLPLDKDGNVQYPVFMAAFDTRRGVPSLFEASPAGNLGRTNEEQEGLNVQLENEESGTLGRGRSVAQLFQIIKALVKNHYQAAERVFEKLDEKNTKRLSQETFYQLLKRFDIHPEVSRGEIRHLWVTLITNQDRTLDFLQLARHFGYSPKSSCFPNAKRSPPKKGDENLRQCSRKLHCVSDILADGVRAKVELSLDELRAEFEELDPYRTGFVSQEEFQEVLKGLCVHLDDYEWEMLAQKFDINRDGRVSFVEFLRPFGRRKQPWRHGSNMAGILQFHNETEDLSAEKGSSLCDQVPLSSRLRKKLQRQGKILRRAFHRLDSSDSGYLSPGEFRAALRLCDVPLDPEEYYHVLAGLDRDLAGRVAYRRLIQDIRKRRTSGTRVKSHHHPS